MTDLKRYIWYNPETELILRPAADKADNWTTNAVPQYDVEVATDLYYGNGEEALEHLTDYLHDGMPPMDDMENWEIVNLAAGLPIPNVTPRGDRTELEPLIPENQVNAVIYEYVTAVMPFAKSHYKRTGHPPEQCEIKDVIESTFGSVELKEYPVSVIQSTGGNSFSDTSPALSACSLGSAFKAIRKHAKDAVLSKVFQMMEIKLEDVEPSKTDKKANM